MRYQEKKLNGRRVRCWNRLPREVGMSLQISSTQLDKPLSSLSQFLPALLEKWDQENRSHFQIMLFCDSAVKSQ